MLGKQYQLNLNKIIVKYNYQCYSIREDNLHNIIFRIHGETSRDYLHIKNNSRVS